MVKSILTRHLDPYCIVIDGGSNYGLYSLLAAQLPVVRKIYSIELAQDTCSFFSKTIKFNNLDNRIILINACLADKIGDKFQIVNNNDSGLRKAVSSQDIDSQSYEVLSTTLDHIALNMDATQDAIFIKLDLEGSEIPALQGARQLLKSGRDWVLMVEVCSAFIENIPRYNLSRYAKELLSLGASDILIIDTEQERLKRVTSYETFVSDLKGLHNILLSKRSIDSLLFF